LPRKIELSAAVDLAKMPRPEVPLMDVIIAAAIDINDETWETKWTFDKIRFGLEIVWKLPPMAVSGRVGSNYGYITLGAGIQFMFMDFDYAFYSDQNANWHGFSLNMIF
jgi:hypothetical protein